MTQHQREPRRRRIPKHALISSGAVIAVVVVMGALSMVVARAYDKKMMPNVRIGDINVSGKKPDEVLEMVKQRMDALENEGLTIRIGEKRAVFDFTLDDPNGFGLTADLLSFDAEATVDRAYAIGRGNGLLDALNRIACIVMPRTVMPVSSLDTAKVPAALEGVLSNFEDPVVEPGFSAPKNGAVELTPGTAGDVLNYDALTAVVRQRVIDISNEDLTASLVYREPEVRDDQARGLLGEVRTAVKDGPLKLRVGSTTVSVTPSEYVKWYRAAKNDGDDQLTYLSVSSKKIQAYLEGILPEVNVLPKNARFILKDGKVTESQSSSSGSELDIEAALSKLTESFPKGGMTVTLPMRKVEPQATADNIGNLGVVEMVASGRTNFAGSPANRRHNIKVGSDLLNGILIKPGEEFTLINTIGPVDATLGYKQELVIKGNKTTPEFGGGLCQIGTTLFRAVLNAGLPVLERQNHSYRVSYYEPPVGMDATIYEPKPDFRFKNDYKGYLLLQAHIEGDNLIFEFWGKKDGRTVTTTAPRVFNVVAAPEKLTIETTDIPAGTTKCTEKAHVGSDAEFTYTVTASDGTKKDQLFKSHYKPWRAVCYVGVKSLTPEKVETNSNTNSNVNANKNTNVNSNTNQNSNTNAVTPVNTNTPEDVNTNVLTNTNTVP